ncbi:MAG: hypothetical protein JO250_20770 [Armatimonadetes bacterium]|nr:hypothetical protein [Armatimonadota bacterium]
METLWEGTDGLPVARAASPAERAALVRLFGRVAEEQGWRPGDALERYRARSVYFAARAGGELAGGLQLVPADGSEGAPHRAVWPEVDVPGGPGEVAHVLILALVPEHRGKAGLLWPLCVALWRFCVREGVRTLLLEATPTTLAVYRRLGFPLHVIGGLREHWGEDCYLCETGVGEVADALAQKAVCSPAYRRIVEAAHRGCAIERHPAPAPVPLAPGPAA